MPAIVYVSVDDWFQWWREHVDMLSVDPAGTWRPIGGYEHFSVPIRLNCGVAVHIQYLRRGRPLFVEILFDSDEAATFYALGGTSLTS